jgi:HEAT repeat protein
MTKITKTFSPVRVGMTLLLLLVLSSSIVLNAQSVYKLDQDIAKLNRFVQSSRSNPAAMKMFKEGRDLIESQNWPGAAEKFNDYIKGFPKDKDLDAALYWYGYALQKQSLKDQAKVPLIKLINNFPGSSWRKEAEALLVYLGEQNAVDDSHFKDNCEIKILALQSLFQADEERAIAIVTESLKSSASKPCQGFQAAAVSILGGHGGPRVAPLLLDIARNNSDLKVRLTAIKRLGDQRNDQVTDELIKLYDTDRTKEIRSQILRALVESRTARGTAKVLEVASNGDDPAIRMAAIRYVADLKDANSLDALIRIYDTDKTPQVRSQVLQALSDREDPRARAKVLDVAKNGDTPEMRLEAIRRLGDHGRVSLDDLLQLYSSETNMQIKQGLLRAFGNNKDPRAVAKLVEVARGNDPVELRAYAIRQLGNKDDEQTVTQLIAIYDSEQNLQIRGSLLRAFGDSKLKMAVQKLMSIARNDPSVELRKMAVSYLGQSKDPDALRFLEELLK